MPLCIKSQGVLYHYTSHDTLYNIVESGAIRASHVYYMNDQNEIKYAIDKFIKIIEKYCDNETCPLKKDLLTQIPAWIQNMRNNPHYIFAFSLSEKGNLLSQWRAYTTHGTGISIGFNQADLAHFAKNNELLLVKCLYVHEEQEAILKSALEKILSAFEKGQDNLSKGAIGQEYYSYLNRFTDQLLKEFIKIKDPAFSEECEWRLVSFTKSIQIKILILEREKPL